MATLAGAVTTPGHGLTFAYTRKVRGALEDCRRQGIAFLPMAAESFRGWHGVAEVEVKKLGAALARNTGQEEGKAVHSLDKMFPKLKFQIYVNCGGVLNDSLLSLLVVVIALRSVRNLF